MRVRSGRFIAAKLMAGDGLAAGNASPGRVQRHAEVCPAPPCDGDVRSFGLCRPTMTSADFCIVTAPISERRAVAVMVVVANSSQLAAGNSPQRLDLGIPVWSDPGSSPSSLPHAMQISLRQMSELSVHKRRIYRRLSPDTNSPVDCSCPGSASHLLHSSFPRTIPRGFALAFGSWLSLLP